MCDDQNLWNSALPQPPTLFINQGGPTQFSIAQKLFLCEGCLTPGGLLILTWHYLASLRTGNYWYQSIKKKHFSKIMVSLVAPERSLSLLNGLVAGKDTLNETWTFSEHFSNVVWMLFENYLSAMQMQSLHQHSFTPGFFFIPPFRKVFLASGLIITSPEASQVFDMKNVSCWQALSLWKVKVLLNNAKTLGFKKCLLSLKAISWILNPLWYGKRAVATNCIVPSMFSVKMYQNKNMLVSFSMTTKTKSAKQPRSIGFWGGGYHI